MKAINIKDESPKEGQIVLLRHAYRKNNPKDSAVWYEGRHCKGKFLNRQWMYHYNKDIWEPDEFCFEDCDTKTRGMYKVTHWADLPTEITPADNCLPKNGMNILIRMAWKEDADKPDNVGIWYEGEHNKCEYYYHVWGYSKEHLVFMCHRLGVDKRFDITHVANMPVMEKVL